MSQRETESECPVVRDVDAETRLRRLVAEKPEQCAVLHDLGALLTQSKRPEEALVYLRQALRLSENFLDGYNSLGLALLALGRWDEARDAFEQCLRISPRWPPGHVNLATAFKEAGRLGEAIAEYEFAISLDPNSASAHWNLSLALLQAGQYECGFAEYEWRWRREQSPPRPFPQPAWDGKTDLSGKTLLLHSEQGLGDTVQFGRFAPLVKAKSNAARVVLECPSPLAQVMTNLAGVDELVCDPTPLPSFDFHLPLMSAPHVLGTALETIPAQMPYIHVDEARVASFRSVLRPERTSFVKVGVVWQGNPHHQMDRFRSIPLSILAPLTQIPNVRLYSLQQGPGTEQLDDGTGRRLGVIEVLPRHDNPGASEWADTAALLSCMDVIISVDTAPVHLAGALCLPVWVLLAATSDWRWLTTRADSPWYPTARLFRQRTLGDWRTVIDEVARELSELARRRVTSPSAPEPILDGSKLLTVLVGCYGDYPQYSVRALQSIRNGHNLSKQCSVVVGLNECGSPTTGLARELKDAGIVATVIECGTNLNKDPMLRVMLETVRTPYVLWLDDDSYFTDPVWPELFVELIRRNHPFDTAGHVHFFGPNREADTGYMHFIASRPWWRGDSHYPSHRRKSVPFPLGGCFVARTAFLRAYDFPDRGMTKWLDDVALGELLLQVGGRLVTFGDGILSKVRINDGERRGDAGPVEDG